MCAKQLKTDCIAEIEPAASFDKPNMNIQTNQNSRNETGSSFQWFLCELKKKKGKGFSVTSSVQVMALLCGRRIYVIVEKILLVSVNLHFLCFFLLCKCEVFLLLHQHIQPVHDALHHAQEWYWSGKSACSSCLLWVDWGFYVCNAGYFAYPYKRLRDPTLL